MASLQVMKYGFMSKISWRSFCGQEGQVGIPGGGRGCAWCVCGGGAGPALAV